MSKSIRVSPKHGVNPTISVCPWCGEDKNEILLLGRLPNDAEAPHRMISNYDPCDECKKAWSEAVIVMEVTTHINDERPPITKNGEILMYPTFNYVGIKPEAAERIGLPSAPGTCISMDTEDFNKLFGNVQS